MSSSERNLVGLVRLFTWSLMEAMTLDPAFAAAIDFGGRVTLSRRETQIPENEIRCAGRLLFVAVVRHLRPPLVLKAVFFLFSMN